MALAKADPSEHTYAWEELLRIRGYDPAVIAELRAKRLAKENRRTS